MREFRRVLLLMMLCCVGCAASVPLAPPELDQVAKHFQAPVGEALLYVVRRPGEEMMPIFQVVVDRKILGSVASGTYLVIPVTPGPHRIASFTADNQVEVTVIAHEGTLYFLQMSTQMGENAIRVHLETLDAAAGREAVQAAVRAQGLTTY